MVPLFPLPPPTGPDAYSELLSTTRGLLREQRAARDTWFQSLAVEGKEDLLFEFEVLLKGTACFANPRNHPGPPRRSSIVGQDFRDATHVLHSGLEHAIGLARRLLGAKDRAFLFQRYLETVLPEDNVRARLLQNGSDQTSPEECLVALRHGLTTANEVVDGLLRARRVPFRMFYAVLTLMQREVGRNPVFNPLSALEFRPEFDRIKSPQVLDLIRGVPGDEARRLVALTFLSLFRMLRYLRLLSRISSELGNRRRNGIGRAYLVLSVLRSDARALSDYLRQHSGSLLAQCYERELLQVPAAHIKGRAAEFRANGVRMLDIKSALEAIAGNLRLEMRRAFQQHLAPPSVRQSIPEMRGALQATITDLRPALRNPILFLGKALGVSLEEGRVFDDLSARRETSERLRRDVWMFAQIVRAFATKAQHSPTDDRWTAVFSFEFVREFLAYFRAMGYPLLRATDYPRFDAFLSAMEALGDTELVDPTRLDKAIQECIAFHEFLIELFENISRRDVLNGVPFDRRAAASTLALYLGTSPAERGDAAASR
ncbi:MAG TPA: hypothetical protein VI197_34695 [Polyangiaceae bacterium]